jgi:hypothetical protein
MYDYFGLIVLIDDKTIMSLNLKVSFPLLPKSALDTVRFKGVKTFELE